MISFSITETGINQAVRALRDKETGTMVRVGRELHEWGIEFTFIAQVLSPKDKLRGKDWRRRPKGESFSQSWVFEVNVPTPELATLDISNVDPRAEWIVEGTDPRPIPRGLGNTSTEMYFYWEDGPQGEGFYTAWVIIGGVAGFGTPPHPVADQTLENFNLDAHVARLANMI